MKKKLDNIAAIMAGTARTVLELKEASVHAIDPRASVYDAIVMMDELKVGALLVMEGSALLGIVSERDYARKVILQGRASKETTVDEIMSSPAITIEPTTSLSECMRLVTERRIRHLPVIDGGRVVGVISIRDIVSAIALQQAELIEQLNTVIQGPYPA
jgi:CBS domain-containing protein